MVKNLENILKKLLKKYPDVKTSLKYSNNFELLVSVILSAQCTDKKVNEVTEKLFKILKKPEDYASVSLEKLENYIKPTGFFRNKAKNIQKTARIILKDFNSKVPDTMEEMLKLSGVARKTANVVLGNAYGVVEGIAVDTHVKRLSQRMGFSKSKNPDQIEKDLMKIIPRSQWFIFTYLLIEHGRTVCKSKKPGCHTCVLNELCPSAFKV
ncbi:MAG: endonuclease III [Actinomycetia bacterium]|nr:endonuclease III [Actinomycetes bacterium]